MDQTSVIAEVQCDASNEGSNAGPTIETHAARCTEEQQLAARARTRGGMESLNHNHLAGVELVHIKGLTPHGDFGRRVDALCGCSRTWAAKLMNLATHWDRISAALELLIQEAKGNEKEIKQSHFSVEGALRLIENSNRTGTTKTSGRRGKPHAYRSHSETRSPDEDDFRSFVQSELELVKAELADLKIAYEAAEGFAAFVEDQVPKLDNRTSNRSRQPISPADKGRIESVAALWTVQGHSESASAAHKLYAMANRLGWDIDAVLIECGVECKADFTFNNAA